MRAGWARRLAGRLIRWLPPALFVFWAVRTLAMIVGTAVPAFGPIDAHLALYRTELLRQLGWGVAIALLWAASWRLVPRLTGRGSRFRRRTKRSRSTRTVLRA